MFRDKNVALFTYGQFRTFDLNLRNNLEIFHSLIGQYNNIHVFILTSKEEEGNYCLKNEYSIRHIFSSQYSGYKLHFIKYVEDFSDEEKDEELYISDRFYKNIRTPSGLSNNKFIPKLMYRKYIVNKYKNNYIRDHNLHIDIHIYFRLFDMKISKFNNYINLPNVEELVKDSSVLLGSGDTIFIGTKTIMDYLLDYVNLVKHNFLYHEYIWRDPHFVYNFNIIDKCLCDLRHTYAPEVQYFARIFYSHQSKFHSLRVDYNDFDTTKNPYAILDIRHCINRFDTPKICSLSSENDLNTIINSIPRYNKSIVDVNTSTGEDLSKIGLSDNIYITAFDSYKNIDSSFDQLRKQYPNNIKYITEDLSYDYILSKYRNLLLGSDIIINITDSVLQWLYDNKYQGIIYKKDTIIDNPYCIFFNIIKI